MSLIAALLWKKAARNSISTIIFNEDDVKVLSKPTIHYAPKGYFTFNKFAKKVIKEFFAEITKLQKTTKKQIIVEFKIVFKVHDVPYMQPARESKYVYSTFAREAKKTQKKIRTLQIQPQLRKRLSGRPLKIFKRELRSLYLVSRKRESGFEYQLWAVALHATRTTYAKKLKSIRAKLVDAMFSDSDDS